MCCFLISLGNLNVQFTYWFLVRIHDKKWFPQFIMKETLKSSYLFMILDLLSPGSTK